MIRIKKRINNIYHNSSTNYLELILFLRVVNSPFQCPELDLPGNYFV
jgi:hypothetical protein